MRDITLIIIIFTIFVYSIFPGEYELIQEANKYIGKKEYNYAFELAEKGIKEYGENQNLLHIKILALLGLKDYELAYNLIENIIDRFGETKKILELKYRVLLLLKKYNKTLNIALIIEEKAVEKNYRDCINIAVAYTNLGDKEKALYWLEEAVNRDFIGLNNLYGDYFNILKDDNRFYKIIEKIQKNIGTGNTAKDFSVEFLAGDNFTLSQQKGKVILVYFWAMDCGSCENELDNLKKYYNEFKNQEFEIIGINLDKDINELKDYIEKKYLKWKISFSGKGWSDEIRIFYGVSFIPSYWLIDKKGILRYFDLRNEKLRIAISELIHEE